MKEKIAIIAIFANVILAGTKIIIGFVSSSSAILAEGIHSFVDIFSSVIGYLGIRFAKKPADEKYPYGHFKFEVLSGAVITLFLFAAGVAIIHEAYQQFLNPAKAEIGCLAFSVMIFSAIVNEVMARIKLYFGKKENSLVLISDGLHSRVDVFASLAIFVGLFFTQYWIFIDSVLALLIGLYIIKESFSLGKEAADSLLDVSAGTEIEDKIKSIAAEMEIGINSLKTQKKGFVITANLEIGLSSNLNVEEAARISDNLRNRMMDKIENLRYVAIQIASHKIATGFYQPRFGRGFGWQGRGRFKEKTEKVDGKGPDGKCICPQCGYAIEHGRGIPCSEIRCPHCKIFLERK
jgi:cation diffusion facilitator family transporter